MQEEFGFIIGAMEDGCVYHTKRNEYIIEIEQKFRDWLEIVQKTLKKLNFKSTIRKTNKKYFRLVCYSKKLWNIINDFKNNPNKILFESNNFQKGFLQGFFDAEGSVNPNRYQISLYSKNKFLLGIAERILDKFGIKCGKISNSRDVLILPIYGKTRLKKFNTFIKFQHKQKQLKLFKLIGE